MKLELKHLAPYLPYGLKCELLNYKRDYVGEKYGIINGFYYLGGEVHYTFKDRSTAGKTRDLIKPILRPLSDLSKKKFKDIVFPVDDYIEENRDSNRKLSVSMVQLQSLTSQSATYYLTVQVLFKNHFDVFGLIKKGLAIDINTLK